MCVCVCVRVRVRVLVRVRVRACVRVCMCVFVTNEDIHLYNDTGMTWVLQGEGGFSGHCPMTPFFKTLINHTE